MAKAVINLDDEAMSQLMSQAIMSSLTDSQRIDVIAQAVKWLNTPVGSTGYPATKPETPLQQAFKLAMNSALHVVVREMIVNDADVRALVEDELRKLVSEFKEQLLSENNYDMRSAMITAMVDHLAEQKNRGY